MKVRSITKNKGKPVIGLSPKDSLDKAVAMLMEHRIGSLIITEANGTMVGILSERDILKILDTHPDQWNQMLVNDAMTPNPYTCEPDNTLEEVMNKMVEHNIRHLPVVYKGKLEGMLSITDIVEELLKKAKFENKLLKNYIQNWPDAEQEI
ncbi:MAG TPA: CBS domain-containing protein [Methylophaga aminisulfidivorans]|jgi:CBS domain-containing protein|uniref:Inosine-5-monophosphate dehydrogenase n=1 Tax=Methylophaga thalassica TaxID=40223 RepID=A0ABQ5TRX7_9GAMM|nr:MULTISPECIES: CBS domain-containing protein [Methylophaga]WVI86293.1 CBS domain-containing protein [Methylophaga thalassica]GLP98545.1 inosine-5-monophosphate dehydrogenase [Methylophaga thalassica]HIC46305.1 CBS domain-containing protein [Methylophaga sp.]HIM40702.1 CBS domain-containing protein [Methylophaga aminisulfidivorans]